MEEFSLKDFKKGMIVKMSAIRETERKFRPYNKQTGELEKDTKTVRVIVVKGTVNDEPYLIPITEGTAMYSQVDDYLDDKGIELPVDNLDVVLTVDMVKSSASKYNYPVFTELTGKDYNSLFD